MVNQEREEEIEDEVRDVTASKRQKLNDPSSVNSAVAGQDDHHSAINEKYPAELDKSSTPVEMIQEVPVEEEEPPEPVYVESAKRNMMDYIVALAAR